MEGRFGLLSFEVVMRAVLLYQVVEGMVGFF